MSERPARMRCDLFLADAEPPQVRMPHYYSTNALEIETGRWPAPVLTVHCTPAQALELGEQIVRAALAVLTPHEFSDEYLASLRRDADRAEQPAENGEGR